MKKIKTFEKHFPECGKYKKIKFNIGFHNAVNASSVYADTYQLNHFCLIEKTV